jgi:hypothetical protein
MITVIEKVKTEVDENNNTDVVDSYFYWDLLDCKRGKLVGRVEHDSFRVITDDGKEVKVVYLDKIENKAGRNLYAIHQKKREILRVVKELDKEASRIVIKTLGLA